MPGEGNRQHVAAKLMDYLGARRPIVGIISASSEMARLAADYGDLRLVDPYTEEGVAAVVEALLAEHREGLLQRPVDGRRPLSELTRQRADGQTRRGPRVRALSSLGYVGVGT